MKITLKKASELSRALLAVAKTITPNPRASISAYSEITATEAADATRVAFFAALERQQGAITAAYRIRAMVGIANSAAGVDGNLALVAAIDEQLLRLTAVAKPENLFDDATPIDDLAALDRKVAKMRADLDAPESRERYTVRTESLTIDIMGAETKGFIADLIAVLKRQRASLKDDLTATNFNTTITLADEEVAVLRAEKLID